MNRPALSPWRQAVLREMGVDVWVPRGGVSELADAPNAPQEEPAPAAPAGADTEAFLNLNKEILTCTRCALAETRTQAVCGVGNFSADLMVIGEAPGADEDRQGEPFVGRAGQLLNQMLRAIGLQREQVFIANVLKCRPPNNRDPNAGEISECLPFLERQIEMVDPQAILIVGRIAAHNLLGVDTPIGKLRGTVHQCGARHVPTVVTYHPAYLLRSPDQKAKSWQDLLRVQDLMRGARA